MSTPLPPANGEQPTTDEAPATAPAKRTPARPAAKTSGGAADQPNGATPRAARPPAAAKPATAQPSAAKSSASASSDATAAAALSAAAKAGAAKATAAKAASDATSSPSKPSASRSAASKPASPTTAASTKAKPAGAAATGGRSGARRTSAAKPPVDQDAVQGDAPEIMDATLAGHNAFLAGEPEPVSAAGASRAATTRKAPSRATPIETAPTEALPPPIAGTSYAADGGTVPPTAGHPRTVTDFADRLDDTRFFSTLFDFSFTSYVTRKLAGPVYVVGLVLIGLSTLLSLIYSLTIAVQTHSFFGAFVFLFGMIITLVGTVLAVLLLRVGIEVFVAIIEIAQNTRGGKKERP